MAKWPSIAVNAISLIGQPFLGRCRLRTLRRQRGCKVLSKLKLLTTRR